MAVGDTRHHWLTRPRLTSRARGFTLLEMIVVAVIVGLLLRLILSASSYEWQRERVNSVAVGLAGWLEEIRSNALKVTDSTTGVGSNAGCTVTFTAFNTSPNNTAPAFANSTNRIASVPSSSCATTLNFRPPSLQGSADQYEISISNNSTTPSTPASLSLTYTPRGALATSTVNGVANTAGQFDTTINIWLRGSTQLRCVQISSILGLIRVGSNGNATSVSSTCTSYTYF